MKMDRRDGGYHNGKIVASSSGGETRLVVDAALSGERYAHLVENGGAERR